LGYNFATHNQIPHNYMLSHVFHGVYFTVFISYNYFSYNYSHNFVPAYLFTDFYLIDSYLFPVFIFKAIKYLSSVIFSYSNYSHEINI